MVHARMCSVCPVSVGGLGYKLSRVYTLVLPYFAIFGSRAQSPRRNYSMESKLAWAFRAPFCPKQCKFIVSLAAEITLRSLETAGPPHPHVGFGCSTRGVIFLIFHSLSFFGIGGCHLVALAEQGSNLHSNPEMINHRPRNPSFHLKVRFADARRVRPRPPVRGPF